MFTLTAKVDYAIKGISYLAQNGHAPAKSEAITTAQGIPQPFLRSILTDLKRAGLVGSMRGANGGHWLLKSPDQISLLDIFVAVDPPAELRMAAGLGRDTLREVWERIHSCELAILESVSIADVLGTSSSHTAGDTALRLQ